MHYECVVTDNIILCVVLLRKIAEIRITILSILKDRYNNLFNEELKMTLQVTTPCEYQQPIVMVKASDIYQRSPITSSNLYAYLKKEKVID